MMMDQTFIQIDLPKQGYITRKRNSNIIDDYFSSHKCVIILPSGWMGLFSCSDLVFYNQSM